jgi:hypothetical protein
VTFNQDNELMRLRGRGRALPAVFLASLLLWALLLALISRVYWALQSIG